MDDNMPIPMEPGSPETAPATEPRPIQPAPPRQSYSYTPPPRITYPTTGKDLLFGLGYALLSLVLVNGLVFAGPNLAFSLAASGILISTFFYLRSRAHTADGYVLGLLGLCLAICLAFPRGDDGALKALGICLLLVVPSLSYSLMAKKNLRNPAGITSLLDGFQTLFGLGFGKMGEAGRGVRQAWSSTGKLGKTSSAVLLGLLIAVPLLAILIPLLMFADAAFEGLLDLLPEFKWQEILVTLIFGTGLGYVFYTRAVALHNQAVSAPRNRSRKGLSAITVNTVLCAVGFVYLVYLFSQLAYFVGGFSGILPEGYTLAQYARRGFFEMGWLCAINLSIIALSVGLVSAQGSPGKFTKILCLFIGLVTLFLVATASAKMFLYIRSYGLTRLRVITEVFMLWLALTTVFVCVWLFRPKMGYMKPAVLTFLALFAALMWLDVDTQVARYNVRAYQKGSLETVDVSHLAQLSDGAVPYLYELTEDSNAEIAQKAQDILHTWTENGNTVRSWNYASGKAARTLEPFRAKEIGKTLGLDLTGCEVNVIKNTRYSITQPLEYAVSIELTDVHREILAAENEAWYPFPLPDPIAAALYGNSGRRGPYFTDSEGQVQIPQIQEGKFWFLNRKGTDLVPYSWINLHSDYEMHFTLAVWDSQNNILYFFMKDTP